MTGELGNKRMGGDHPNNSIEIGQNTEKGPRDLLSLKLHWETIGERWFEKLEKE